jgi:hypothetical protein
MSDLIQPIPVCVLDATGSVGQRFIQLRSSQPASVFLPRPTVCLPAMVIWLA